MASIYITRFLNNAFRNYYDRNKESNKQSESSVSANDFMLAAAGEFIESNMFSISIGAYDTLQDILNKFVSSGKMQITKNGEIYEVETGYNKKDSNGSIIPIVSAMSNTGAIRVSRSEMEPKTTSDVTSESSVIKLEEYKIEEDGIYFSHSTLPLTIDANGKLTLQDGMVDTFMYSMESLKQANFDKDFPQSLMSDMGRFEIASIANVYIRDLGLEPDKEETHPISISGETTSMNKYEVLKLKIKEIVAIIEEDKKGLGQKQ